MGAVALSIRTAQRKLRASLLVPDPELSAFTGRGEPPVDLDPSLAWRELAPTVRALLERASENQYPPAWSPAELPYEHRFVVPDFDWRPSETAIRKVHDTLERTGLIDRAPKLFRAPRVAGLRKPEFQRRSFPTEEELDGLVISYAFARDPVDLFPAACAGVFEKDLGGMTLLCGCGVSAFRGGETFVTVTSAPQLDSGVVGTPHDGSVKPVGSGNGPKATLEVNGQGHADWMASGSPRWALASATSLQWLGVADHGPHARHRPRASIRP